MSARLPWIELAGYGELRAVLVARGESGTTYVVHPDGAGWAAHAELGLLNDADFRRLGGGLPTRELAQRRCQEIEIRIHVRERELACAGGL